MSCKANCFGCKDFEYEYTEAVLVTSMHDRKIDS